MSITDQLTGFHTTYTGTVRNVVAVEKSNADKSKRWIENQLAMEHFSTDGMPVIVQFRLSKAAMDADLFSKLKGLVGKHIRFTCTSQERIYNNRIYKDFYFSQITLPEIIPSEQRRAV